MRGNLILNSKDYLLRTPLILLGSSHLGSTPSLIQNTCHLVHQHCLHGHGELTNNFFKNMIFQINVTKYFESTSHDESSNIYLKSLPIYLVFDVLIDS